MSPSKLVGLVLQWTVGEVLVLAALVFIQAWTIHYWQGWVVLVVFVVSTNAVGIYVLSPTLRFWSDAERSGPGRNSDQPNACSPCCSS